MDGTIIALVFVGVIVILPLVWVIANYNRLVRVRQHIRESWSGIDVELKRRYELIPNLVNTVKGAAEFERGTLEAVTEARAKASSININANDLTPEMLEQFQAAQAQVSQGLGRLLATAEAYPQLQSNAQFQALQDELAGTENRIAVARSRFNEVATDYNKQVRRFPGAVFASVFGFDQKPQFQAEAGAQNAPTVEF